MATNTDHSANDIEPRKLGSCAQDFDRKVLDLVPPGANKVLVVADLYCGLGEAIKTRMEQSEVWAINWANDAVLQNDFRLDRVIPGGNENLDFSVMPLAYFECVLFCGVFEHVSDPMAMLLKVKPYLAHQATLICSAPNVAHWKVILQLLHGHSNFRTRDLLDGTHSRFFTPFSLRNLIWDSGYIVTEEHAILDPEPIVQRALGLLGDTLGMDPMRTQDLSGVRQQVYSFVKRPNAAERPELLHGPHRHCLGSHGCRCSVVVVTYNSAQTLTACLTSLLESISLEDEVIIFDNASSDSTVCQAEGYARTDSRIAIYRNKDNEGYAKAANSGALKSRGEFIVFLNPDTRVWPGWIEKLIAECDRPGIGAVGPLSDNAGGDQFGLLHVEKRRYHDPEEFNQDVCESRLPSLETHLLTGFCLMCSRQTLDTFGLLDESMFLGADDLELSWRLRELGLKLVISTTTFVHHLGSASFDSITPQKKRDLVGRSDAALVEKLMRYYGRLPTSIEIWRSDIFAEALARSRRPTVLGNLSRDFKY